MSRVMVRDRVSESTHDRGRHLRRHLVSESLKDSHGIWLRWFQHRVEARYEATKGGLEMLADLLRECCESELNRFAVIKLIWLKKNVESGSFEIAESQKYCLRRFVEQLAARMDLPDIAASATVLILERTIVEIFQTGDLSEFRTAQLLFQCLQRALERRCTDQISD
jgi:hypothetical protein